MAARAAKIAREKAEAAKRANKVPDVSSKRKTWLGTDVVGSNLGEEILTREESRASKARQMATIEEHVELHIVASVLSPYSEEDIRKISVVIITDPDITSPTEPKPGSLYDTNMGSIVSGRRCTHCKYSNCLGHYGRIPFASPIPHPLWIGTIKDILTSVCNSCGSLLVPEDVIRRKGWDHFSTQNRISHIAKHTASSKLRCSKRLTGCPDMKDGTIAECAPNPTFLSPKVDDSYKICFKVKKDSPGVAMEVETILDIFKCISNTDAKMIGFTGDARPESLVMQSLLAIPPIARIPFANSVGSNNPSDLTEGYKQIVICANLLALNPEDDTIKNSTYFAVKKLMEGKKQKYKNVRKFMGIGNLLQGKRAVPRDSMMGKRTNMCARTVVSPDTTLEFNQIRLPREWASLLTVPEEVTRGNLEAMRELHRAGKVTEIQRDYSDIASYRKPATPESRIEVGYRIWRYLQDGDIVVANRQPTLHKFSMMGFEVKLGDARTIGLHLSYTTPFNADFDGDEMNIWVPQSIGAIAEANNILHVKLNIMSPAKNKVNMGLVYDAITASYLLTREKKINEGLFMELKTKVADGRDLITLDQRLRKYRVPPRSGRAAFSMVLPAGFYYFKDDVVIMDGVLVSGKLTGKHVGPSGGSIVEKIYMQYGSDRYAEFITYSSYLVLKYITERGHTVGIADAMAIDSETRKAETRENDIAFEIIQSKVDALGPIPLKGSTLRQLYENNVKNIIRASAEMGFSLIKNNISDINNNIGVMLADIGGGAKGKVFNIQQIRGRLGQQYRRGEPLGIAIKGNKILPAFDKDETDIRAGGYIKSNFMQGLQPEEFFLHMMGAREGLIDTAVNVAKIGDIRRRLVKALESILISDLADTTNPGKANFQLLYGGDGFDPAKLTLAKRYGSDGDPVAVPVNFFSLAKEINVQNGWVSESDVRSVNYNIYVIKVTYTLHLVKYDASGQEIERVEDIINSDDYPVSTNLIAEALYEGFKGEETLQSVIAADDTIGPEGERIPNNELFFYYRLTDDDGSIGNSVDKLQELQEKYDIESDFQVEYLDSLVGEEIALSAASGGSFSDIAAWEESEKIELKFQFESVEGPQ